MPIKLRTLILSIFVAASLTILPLVGFAQETEVHWTYEGEEGPEHWGDIKDEYTLCGTGTTQSPIDITTTVSTDIGDIAFNYAPSALNIFNNGHTIQAAYDPGSFIVYNDVQYALLQFHFHHHSEHSINGVTSPLEIHFVHRSAEGALAVVGVMLNEGDANADAYASIFANAPTEASEIVTIDGATINASDMLPAEKTYYTYTGSLTTPPCSEGVRWLLLDTPLTLSTAQIEAFGSIFELNARPIQPQNARDVINDSATTGG
ncbi:MAG: carbonic anhydrase family protein [Chloroflexota bacterium]|nr:carbonic anhydrase family protein [Chloroflexota bacterium]